MYITSAAFHHKYLLCKIFTFRIKYLFKPAPGEQHPDYMFYRRLFPKIIQDIEVRVFEFYLFIYINKA